MNSDQGLGVAHPPTPAADQDAHWNAHCRRFAESCFGWCVPTAFWRARLWSRSVPSRGQGRRSTSSALRHRGTVCSPCSSFEGACGLVVCWAVVVIGKSYSGGGLSRANAGRRGPFVAAHPGGRSSMNSSCPGTLFIPNREVAWVSWRINGQEGASRRPPATPSDVFMGLPRIAREFGGPR